MGGFGGDWGIGLSAPSVRFSATSPVKGEELGPPPLRSGGGGAERRRGRFRV